ncbi:uncharacterized protein LOC111997755 [Quercus suber]|uniref:uncharacterized protein LOC111997755 n=1 Tax=Quercus suber TaxID=58331 RepID=UPI0032DFF437
MQYATPRPPLPSATMKRDHHNHNNHHHQKPIHHSTIPCGACGSSDRWPLHTVRHRGSYRRLCTDCVLKNHQSLFCPLCFQVFDEMPPPLPVDRLVCLNCPSIAHRSCVPPDSSAPSFLCPPCSNPNFSYFFSDSDPDAKTKRIKTEDGGNSSLRGHNEKAIDKESAKALLAAAKIAAASMSKAAATAQAEAEKRVKDASLAKKKAKEALERLAFLVLKDKDKEKQDSKQLPLSVTPIQALISNKGNGSGGGDGGGAAAAAAAKATNGLHSLSAAAAAFSQQSSGGGGGGGHATKTPN